ncbi:hypothetical protein J1N35_013867 [Gossypium stocksii]|uniref:Uncharacterized protein n=1 Tax=Gossypium stocksii TaxID=47602 RepID=A0A9D3VVM1_9ROSI|nr:hypothetical protein J1N35_013867 [Gossypium stocksii]
MPWQIIAKTYLLKILKSDNRKVTEALGAVFKRRSWPYVLYGAIDHLGRILTGLKEEPRNFYYNYIRIKLCPRVVLGSQWVGSGPYINLIIVISNVRIVGDRGTTHNLESDTEETNSTLQELNEAMDIIGAVKLRATLRAQRKRCRTNTRAVNMVVGSMEGTDSGRIVSL